jgi:dipeptidyl aminopeptidase/acylaminoacyl peptidase
MRLFCLIFVSLFCAGSLIADTAPRAIQLTDIYGWKRIQSPVVSNDGTWFVYRLSPNEGDSEVVIRNLKDGKETRFAIGEPPVPRQQGPFVPQGPQGLEISEDSKWVFITMFPRAADARKAKKDKKPLYNKVTLVELATGKKLEFDKVKSAAFAGERGGWIALHKYTTEAQDKELPPAKWAGSDLILHELASGAELNLGNVGEFAFNKPGTYLALVIDASEKTGNGVQLRDMATGAVTPLDSGKASYKSLSWTEKGDGLAVLKGVEDKAFEDKLYALVGFKSFSGTQFTRSEFDPKKDSAFPAGMTISANRKPSWTEDLSAITFGLQTTRKKKDTPKDEKPAAAKDEPDKPDMLVWHWEDKRIQPMQQVQEQQDRNYSYLAIYWPTEQKFARLADDKLRQVALTPKDRFAIGRDNSPYELDSNLTGARYEDIYIVDLKTGGRKLALTKNRWYFGPSPDGTHFLYYDDGNFFAYDITAAQSKNITQGAGASFINTEDDHNVQKQPRIPMGWTADSASVLIEDGWDLWRVPLNGKATNLTGNGKRDKIRYLARYRLDPEEKGIDLAKPMYLNVCGEWTKKGGIGLIDPGANSVKMLTWDDATYGSVMKARKADTYLFTRQTVKEFPDYHVAGPALASATKVTDANPQQKDFFWSSGAKLIDYSCDHGTKAQAALFLPANYEPGKKYPTVVYIYEKLSQQMNTYLPPALDDRFNRSVYNSNGYAVVTPDITYQLNDPGKSAVGCVVPALKAAIADGVVDADKVGLQGHSWGGYETAFLVTQTNMFKTAIAGAPLTDMVSMYNSVYWNTGGANQAIFESSQGRFTSGFMDNPQPYIRNSPIYQAVNVKTPLMILHNDKDGAVDFTQGIEYFNTLRRLHKPVVMLEYKGENHHLSKPENEKDFLSRMKEYFDFYLMGKPEPAWLKDGVPLIKLKDHLDERAVEVAKPASATEQQK